MKRSSNNSAAFTLAEILLAMGILSIGMVMVATVFPAAILQSKDTYHETLSTIISENAQVMVMARLRHGDIPYQMQEVDDALLNPLDRKFIEPGTQNRDTSRYGWLLLGRRLITAPNDYQFVVVPYARFIGETDDPALKSDTASIEADTVVWDRDSAPGYGSLIKFTDAESIAIGSPVIVPQSGDFAYFAYIVGVTDSGADRAAILSRPLPTGSGEVFVVPGLDSEGRSPALGAYVFRTSLRP